MAHKELRSVLNMSRNVFNRNNDEYHALKVFDFQDVYYILMYDYSSDIAYLVSEDSVNRNKALLMFYPNCEVALTDGRIIGRTFLSRDNLRWCFGLEYPGFNQVSVNNDHPDALFDLEIEVAKEFILLNRVRPSLFQ